MSSAFPTVGSPDRQYLLGQLEAEHGGAAGIIRRRVVDADGIREGSAVDHDCRQAVDVLVGAAAGTGLLTCFMYVPTNVLFGRVLGPAERIRRAFRLAGPFTRSA